MHSGSDDSATTAPPRPTFGEAFLVWGRIGLLSFGGPAGQIALMHRELVEERRWISEARFLHALNYCMLLPGPEAQQLAVYIGWLLHRTPGGLAAGILFVLPGFFVILALSMLYALFREVPTVDAALFGLKAAVVAIVVEALVRIARRALAGPPSYAIAVVAFTAIFFFDAPFPLVVLAAGIAGLGLDRLSRTTTGAEKRTAENRRHLPSVVDLMAERGELAHTEPRRGRSLRVLALGLAIWWAPVLALLAVFGRESVFVDQALFFSRAAVVTFGGAYSVLAYVAQQAVDVYAWLAPGEMLDGLGLAETTPGPLILVLQFVGFMGGFRHPAALDPTAAGVLASIVTVWVTFVPCFLWIFLGAPHIEALRGNRRLQQALSAITAAVVGVVANLSLWFALHVWFAEIVEVRIGPLRLLQPNLATIDWRAVALTAFALFATFRLHLGIPKTLAACAALGLLLRTLA
jgi:chromate transporter